VFLSEVPFDRDGDFSLDTFVDRYNADLANDYGNLVSRTEKMVARYFEGLIPQRGRREPVDDELGALAERVVEEHAAAMEALEPSAAIAAAQRLVARANRLIEEARPWELSKSGDSRLGTLIADLLEAIRVATVLLHPVIPRATARVAGDLGVSLDGAAGAAARRWEVLRPGNRVAVGEILFPRLERERVLAGFDPVPAAE
jgi:methionyl-tRNA synthetase